MRRIRRRPLAILVLAASALFGGKAMAQMPGVPVLQNAFVSPGITAGLDVAGFGAATSYAAAVAFAPGTARFQLSGGIGLQTRSGSSTRTLLGARLNVPVLGANKNFGASIFAGYGALSGGTIDSTVSKSLVPIGATLSYRLAIGASRGVSIYASPVWESVARGGGASTVGVFRGAVGLDIGITSAIGATLGIEFGGHQPEDSGKPSGTAFGGAISYAIGSRR